MWRSGSTSGRTKRGVTGDHDAQRRSREIAVGKTASNVQLSPRFLESWRRGKCFNTAHQRRLIMIGFALNPV
jgi:hypothetical protein